MRNAYHTILALSIVFLYSACVDSIEILPAIYGDFEVNEERTEISFDGPVNDGAANDLADLLSDYFTIEELNIVNANGSTPVQAAFDMGSMLKANDITVNIKENGKVEKNGLYLFLGGTSRTLGAGAKIGVSSWKTNNQEEAADLAMDDMAHEPYLNYLTKNGFSTEKANSFYFFTLGAAPSNDTYWLSASEIDQFGLLD